MEEKARQSTKTEQSVDHVVGYGGAFAVGVYRREDHLEGEEGAGREEVGQERGFGESLLDAARHCSPFPARGGRWSVGSRWRRR